MPEWKSWTLGSDDDSSFLVPTPEAPAAPTGAAPPAGMEPDVAAAKWSTEIEPVTIERVEKVVEGDGLPHGSTEFVVVTEAGGVRLQLHREPADAAWLQVETRVPLDEELLAGRGRAELDEVANTWNTEHLQPTVFPLQSDGAWALVLATRFFVGEGLSDRQIHAMVRRGIGVTVQAARELPQRLVPRG